MGALRGGLALCLVLMLAACGWQLRGSTGGGFDDVPVALNGAVGNRVLEEVAMRLRELGAEPVQSEANAQVVVQVESAQSSRRTVATDADGFATEYELIYRIRFRIQPGGLAVNAESGQVQQTVQASVAYPANPDDLQALDAEEALLNRELRAEAIQLLLARVGRSL